MKAQITQFGPRPIRRRLLIWNRIRHLAYGVKIAWVSVASVVAGIALLYMASQAQDLFLEVRGSILRSLLFWVYFYLSVIFAWVAPVYISAYWILSLKQPERRFPSDVRAVRPWVREYLPPFLALLCFGAIALGQLLALLHAPVNIEGMLHLGTPRDDTSSDIIGAISQPSRNHTFLETVSDVANTILNFILLYGVGKVTFLLYAIAAAQAAWLILYRQLKSISSRYLRILAAIAWWCIELFVGVTSLAAAIVVISAIIVINSSYKLGAWHLAVLPLTTILLAAFCFKRRRWADFNLFRIRLKFLNSVRMDTKRLAGCYFVVLGFCLFMLFLLFVVHPVDSSRYFFRAQLLPLFLGIFVPAATYASHLSLRWQAPIVSCIILVLSLTAFVVSDPHDIRTVARVSDKSSLESNITRWAEANDCDLTASPASLRACPPPIIVSTAGGASRAAFLTGGLVGKLMDESTTEVAISNKNSDWPEFGPQAEATLAYNTDGSMIVTTTKDLAARLWNADSATLTSVLLGHSAAVKGAEFNRAGDRIVTLSNDRTARLWDGQTGTPVAVLRGHTKAVSKATFSGPGDRLLTVSSDSSAGLWDGHSGDHVETLRWPNEKLNTAAFNAPGTRVVTQGSNESSDIILRLWDGRTGKHIRALQTFKPRETIMGHGVEIRFSPHGNRLVTVPDGAGANTSVQLWDTETGAAVKTLVETADGKFAVEFSPTGDRILILSRPDVLRLFDAKTGNEIAIIAEGGYDSGFYRLDPRMFSPNGDRFVFSMNGIAEPILIETRTGKELGRLTGHKGPAHTAIFSKSGKRLLTSTGAETMVWNGDTGEFMARLQTPKGFQLVGHIEISPGDDRILTEALGGGNYTLVRLYDAATGAELKEISPNIRRIGNLFSVTGARFAGYAAEDNGWERLKVFDSAIGDEIPVAVQGRITNRVPIPFGKQLFAISGVSGGALGAVVSYAALADSQLASTAINGIGKPPCRKDADDNEWFGSRVKTGEATKDPWRPHESWKSCLELLLAGDFLSPSIISLMTDVFQTAPRGDRAAVLENSWERRFALLAGTDRKQGTLAEGVVDVRSRILAANPRNWLPILLLNGTSVATGRRIVTTDVDVLSRKSDTIDNRANRLFGDTYDLDELLANSVEQRPSRVATDSNKPKRDVRLSTAATMSARFPIVSPHGNIRDASGTIVDRVVDGGYYENFGATTALELARELKRYGLRPFVILINNDVGTSGIDCISEWKGGRFYDEGKFESPQNISQILPFAILRAPLDAMIATRTARATYAANQLCAQIEPGMFAFISVSPGEWFESTDTLSMSWWLSMSVQQYLDAQLERPDDNNVAAIQNIRRQR